MTDTITIRRLPYALAICAMIAGIATWIVTAGPAGASASFDSNLRSTAKAAKFAAFDAAPYTQTAVVKRAAVASKPKASKRIAQAPGVAIVVPVRTAGGEAGTAQAILGRLIAKYPILKGSTVEFGDARGYQAISYYRSGRIVVSRTHTASLDRILNHEVWHIIDYRDNNRIDWGEDVPR